MRYRYFNKPDFLAPLDESKPDEDFSILTDRETIRNITKDICNHLHHPVTIFDINRLDSMTATNNVRIDSDIDYFSLRNSCKLLRHCGSEKRCHICDNFHAKMLRDYLCDEKKLKIENWPSFFYDEYKENPPKILSGFDRDVLEYHCPMLGYRELLFPMYYEDRLIAIMFVGQTTIIGENDKDLISTISRSFFSKTENKSKDLFRDYLKYNKIDLSNANEIENLILKADAISEPVEKFLSYSRSEENCFSEQFTMVFKDKQEYHKFIEKACKELFENEKKLYSIVKKKQENYFKKISRKIVIEHFNKTAEIKKLYKDNKYRQSYEELKCAWEQLVFATNRLKAEFGINEIYLFGDGTSLNMIGNKNKTLYSPIIKDDKNNRNWFYNFSAYDSYQIEKNDYISSIEYPDILENLNVDFDVKDHILILYSDIAILLHVNKLDRYKKTYTEMTKAIGQEFVKIRFSIALRTANLMKERQLLTLRMNKHECSHISTCLLDNMDTYFSYIDEIPFLSLEREKQKVVIDDMYNTIKLISHMSNNIGIITGSINAETIKGKNEKLDIFDLLYKWQIMFRHKLKRRNLDFIIIRNSNSKASPISTINYKDAPRHLVIYPELFELIVYNLVDNAVKYAYRGSTIYLSWKETTKGYVLSVHSFGPEIKKDERIYDLYTRGSARHWNAIDGDGIGLYVVKRASALLELSISHKCHQISKYYLPLISWYLSEKFDDNIHKEKKKVLSEYQKKISEEMIDVVLNQNEFTKVTRRCLTKEYLDKRIDRETWLTTFELIIPDTKYTSWN